MQKAHSFLLSRIWADSFASTGWKLDTLITICRSRLGVQLRKDPLLSLQIFQNGHDRIQARKRPRADTPDRQALELVDVPDQMLHLGAERRQGQNDDRTQRSFFFPQKLARAQKGKPGRRTTTTHDRENVQVYWLGRCNTCVALWM